MNVVILVYGAISLVIGGAAATHEIWRRPVLLDRAEGRGKFPSPKMTLGEVIFFGLFVALLWPLLVAPALIDAWSERK